MTSVNPRNGIETPCIEVCTIESESGLCIGCFRTLEEIASWSGMSATRRAALMQDLPAREERIAPDKRFAP